ncbi:hypothetical protein MML48_5g00018725 [Holotrichia oblita]|uniref:Uncharacterized protein n=1 Tax=Holotrichia oblita TaxID=644536 RepID=A0ACB9T5B4_HOLOL|nr:hypothetical protein MML48_5g00018725 [Holotrichia oblita]
MPNIYKRKTASRRGNWTEESLKAAITSVKNGQMTIYSASKIYNIPRKTLERKYKKDNDKKGPMGLSSVLGEQNEQKLVTHIKTMQSKELPLSIDDVRTIAFAERLNISHRFNKTTEKAGYDWMQMFLKRSPDIRLRQSEGVSLARSQALNRVDAYFQLLKQVLTDNDLMGKANCIFNMDESGMQLNNRPGYVLAEKGSKAVSTITSTEKGETITVIGCCNAECTFLPPACIFKEKNPSDQRLTTGQKSNETTFSAFNNEGVEKPDKEFTRSEILKEISPISQRVVEARKRAKQVGILSTSECHIKLRKSKEQEKNAKEERIKIKKEKLIAKEENKTEKIRAARKRKAVRKISESSDDEEEPILMRFRY